MWFLATLPISSTGQDVIDQCKKQSWNKELYSFIISKIKELSVHALLGFFVKPTLYTKGNNNQYKDEEHAWGQNFWVIYLISVNTTQFYSIFLVEMLWFDPSALSLKSKYKYSI